MKLEKLFAQIDKINQQDPNQEISDGQPVAKELLYSHRMRDRLSSFDPQAPETLQIAVYAQHINRWHIARDSYPQDRQGYLQWRRDLERHHAELTANLMQQQGYSETDIASVERIIRKQNLKSDPLSQTLEDVACLVFLEYYFAAMSAKHDDDKMIAIIRKTWGKMSDRGHRAALEISYSTQERVLIEQALDNATTKSYSSP